MNQYRTRTSALTSALFAGTVEEVLEGLAESLVVNAAAALGVPHAVQKSLQGLHQRKQLRSQKMLLNLQLNKCKTDYKLRNYHRKKMGGFLGHLYNVRKLFEMRKFFCQKSEMSPQMSLWVD